MFLVQCEELRINHLILLLVVTMPYVCWCLWHACYMEDFKWRLHFQFEVVSREVYFEKRAKSCLKGIGDFNLEHWLSIGSSKMLDPTLNTNLNPFFPWKWSRYDHDGYKSMLQWFLHAWKLGVVSVLEINTLFGARLENEGPFQLVSRENYHLKFVSEEFFSLLNFQVNYMLHWQFHFRNEINQLLTCSVEVKRMYWILGI